MVSLLYSAASHETDYDDADSNDGPDRLALSLIRSHI